MRSFRSDPYLWIHLAGLAALPIFAGLCLVGFAVSDPFLPAFAELLLVAAIGIAPILWMQWQRPFYIFSLVAIALKPEQLTEDQRRLLTLFKSARNRILAILVPVLLGFGLRQAYATSAIVAEAVPFADTWRILGLLLAAIGFLGCNLFLQVPVSVASVMLTPTSAFAATIAYPLEQVRSNFTLLGLQINQILPPLVLPPQPTPTDSKLKSLKVEPSELELEPAAAAPTQAPDDQQGALEPPIAELPTAEDLSPDQQAVAPDRAEAEVDRVASETLIPKPPAAEHSTPDTQTAERSELVESTAVAPDEAEAEVDRVASETLIAEPSAQTLATDQPLPNPTESGAADLGASEVLAAAIVPEAEVVETDRMTPDTFVQTNPPENAAPPETKSEPEPAAEQSAPPEANSTEPSP